MRDENVDPNEVCTMYISLNFKVPGGVCMDTNPPRWLGTLNKDLFPIVAMDGKYWKEKQNFKKMDPYMHCYSGVTHLHIVSGTLLYFSRNFTKSIKQEAPPW